jgi:hypothetical protein
METYGNSDEWLLEQPVSCSSTPFVKSGLKVTRGKYETEGSGTAGIVVRRKGESSGGYLLTCAHVLGTPRTGTDEAAKRDNFVYSPHFKEFCGIDCNRPIGEVVPETLEQVEPEFEPTTFERFVRAQLELDQEIFAVDAALVKLVSDINSYNHAPEIGQIHTPRDLITEWGLAGTPQVNLELAPSKHLFVKKFGAVSQYSEGVVRRLARATVRRPGFNDSHALEFSIDVNPGQKEFTRELELDMERYRARYGNAVTVDQIADLYRSDKVTVTLVGVSTRPTLKIVSRAFALPGDSGSPIVDQDHRIVGILRTARVKNVFVTGESKPVSIPTGEATAVFVNAALMKLNVNFLEGGQHAAGERILVPGMALERSGQEKIDWAAVHAVSTLIESTPEGVRLANLVRRHFDEIRSMVHHRRRVTVSWHRNKGPAFAVAFLHATQRLNSPAPSQIDGVQLLDAVRAMCNVLVAEGSPALRTAILDHESEIINLVKRLTSLDSLLVALKEPEQCAS